jgi:seryl-tRNA synthetase
MSDDLQKLLGEVARRKFQYRDLLQKFEQLQATNKALEEQHAQLQAEHDETRDAIDQYLEEQENAPPTDYDKELSAMRSQLARKDLEYKFSDLTRGQLQDGVKFNDVLKFLPDIGELDSESINDDYVNQMVRSAREGAGFLFRSSQDAGNTAATESASQGQSIAKRSMPTFMQRSSGGGTPPPTETSLTATRLRDPAEALKRAADARADAAR